MTVIPETPKRTGELLDLPVLVLNVTYEPLSVCNVRRAVNLLLTDKADALLHREQVLHGMRQQVAVPSVIRLNRSVHRPRPQVRLSKEEVFRRDNYTCQYCGKAGGHLTVDHIMPRHLGGAHTWENVITACAACNRRKGGALLHEVGLKLRKTPRHPYNNAAYLYGNYLPDNPPWQQFLEGW